MTDDERAALLRLIEYPAGPGLRVTTPEAAECILRVVEPAIRADERAQVADALDSEGYELSMKGKDERAVWCHQTATAIRALTGEVKWLELKEVRG